MNIVVDTSAVIAVVTNERDRSRIIAVTEGVSLIAPSSLYLEIVNAFSAMLRRNRISLEDACACLAASRRISMRMHAPDLAKALGICP